MNNTNILIVDDNKSVLTSLELLLQNHYENIHTISSPNQIPNLLQKYSFDAILLDMNYSAGINTGNEGIYWLNRILETDPNNSVIMITAYGDIELAVKAVKQGAIDFVLKPWENSKLLATINTAVQLRKSRTEVQNLRLKEQNLKLAINKDTNNIIGESAEIMQVLDVIKKVANTDANVLITGENGTGKELMAQELHRLSNRNKEIMVSIDMGALSETLFESELFGHAKGAFTDAKEDRMGKFEVAKGGTLFLDEIANLSLPLQAKLLSALQNREITRIGTNKKIPIDIRLVCATNANLLELVQKGLFREDLLYRINTIQIEVPPLRERKKDIPLIANFFLQKYKNKYAKPNLKLTANAIKKIKEYTWYGNVRELQHAVEKAVILSDSDKLESADFFFNTTTNNKKQQTPQTLEQMEKNMIEKCMFENKNNMSIVANVLGVSRQTLYNKIKKYKL